MEYRSREDGKIHACGHDSHTAMMLGAARVLAGALGGVGRVLGLHVAPDLPLRTVGIEPDLNNAAVDGFRIVVHGKSIYVSTPELGAGALYFANHILVGIQVQAARRTSPM